MKYGTEIELLKKLILTLERASRRDNAKIWGMVAFYLRKPARQRVEVNLNRLNRIVDNGEVIVVPGKVLGIGLMDKKVQIAAVKFSKSAIVKLQKAGIQMMTIQQVFEKNPKGSKVRIVI